MLAGSLSPGREDTGTQRESATVGAEPGSPAPSGARRALGVVVWHIWDFPSKLDVGRTDTGHFLGCRVGVGLARAGDTSGFGVSVTGGRKRTVFSLLPLKFWDREERPRWRTKLDGELRDVQFNRILSPHVLVH